ncbi:MAG: hypothetical protein WC465_00985 [Patescibacteria group bacterium]
MRRLWIKIKVVYKDKWSAWLINLSLLITLMVWVLFFIRLKDLAFTNLAALHYNIYSGIDLLGSWHWLWGIPLAVLFLSIVNFIVSVVLFAKRSVLSYWLLATIFLSQMMMLIYLYNILNYNLHA